MSIKFEQIYSSIKKNNKKMQVSIDVNENFIQQIDTNSAGVNFLDDDIDLLNKHIITNLKLSSNQKNNIEDEAENESNNLMYYKVNEVIELGQQGGAGNLIICEVVRIHIQEDLLDEKQMIDQHKIDLVSRMGGNWYCRADKNSMFEIQKPITTCGIGFEALPKDVLNSSILTGNDLGQLAGIEELPNETDVNEYKLLELSELFLSFKALYNSSIFEPNP